MLSYNSPVSIAGNTGPADMSANIRSDSVTAPTASADGTSSMQSGNNKKVHHIWLVTGPAGVGKSSVAEYLADALKVPYIEGDDFHPPSNVEKMRNGTPLTDADRWDWLTALREESLRQIHSGSSGVVLTCSALKEKYRDVIRVAGYFDHTLLIHFIYLSAPATLLLSRVQARQDHYMGANMVQSQFDILEPPGPNEKDVVSIDVSGSLEEVRQEALARVLEIMSDEADDANGHAR